MPTCWMGRGCSRPWPIPSSRCTGRLLKLPLEGLREFLQDSLAQPWALEDEAVLRHLRASMTQLRRMRCDLPPPARDLRSSPRGPWAWSQCPRRPGLSSLLRPLSHRPGWRSRPPRAQPPGLSRPDPLPARPSSNLPPSPSGGTPSPPSRCNVSSYRMVHGSDVQAGATPDMVGLKTKNGVQKTVS
ncbi:USP6 N-terminal-like protein [Vulpes lagopus]